MLQERQREQQRTESTNAPIDLRDKLNAGKRARKQGQVSRPTQANRVQEETGEFQPLLLVNQKPGDKSDKRIAHRNRN